ncbi:MAG: hypothetical protein R2867_16895 [Caldilineaceae bacterium]
MIIWLPNRLRAMAIGRTPGGDWLYIRLDNDATGWVSTPLTAPMARSKRCR